MSNTPEGLYYFLLKNEVVHLRKTLKHSVPHLSILPVSCGTLSFQHICDMCICFINSLDEGDMEFGN